MPASIWRRARSRWGFFLPGTRAIMWRRWRGSCARPSRPAEQQRYGGRAAMRRTAVAGHGVGVLAAFAMLLAGACAQREPGEPLHRVTIATGPAGTAYHQIGTNLSTVIEQQLDIASTARPHTGSSLYIPQMHRGELPFGLNNATDTAAAYRGQLVYAPPLDNLRAAMLVSRSPFSTSC